MGKNPYVHGTRDWQRWNVGLEDGSRGEERRGKSTAYNQGWDEGIKRFRIETQTLAFRPVTF